MRPTPEPPAGGSVRRSRPQQGPADWPDWLLVPALVGLTIGVYAGGWVLSHRWLLFWPVLLAYLAVALLLHPVRVVRQRQTRQEARLRCLRTRGRNDGPEAPR